MIIGVDVSSYQPEEFPLVTPGGTPVDFVIIKATQGLGYTNPKLQAQLDWARKNGLSVGFYHFGDAGDIEKQADFFHAAIGPRLRPGDHLWFDWEKRDITSEQKDQWIRRMQADFPGYRVGLYCNREFWLNMDVSDFAGDALWIADWSAPVGAPRIEAAWRIHQYETTRSIDENVADFESRAEMKRWAGYPFTADLEGVMAALNTIADAMLYQRERLDQILEEQRVLAAKVADIPVVEAYAEIQRIHSITASLKTAQASLPKKVADEVSKRLAD